MSEFAVAHLEEIREISDGRCPWRPVRHHFGITSFGVNTWTGREAGDRIINEHNEEGVNEPVGWELWAPFGQLYREGRYAEAADQARGAAESHPEYPALLYNVACCESLAGRKADA